MASNVFPMLSSSPPPMDDCPDDDDEEDEFGNFTSSNIPFDSSFDSPVSVEKFKSFKSGDNGVNNANFSDEIHKFNFSNSTTPSPQEFVPDFPGDSKHSKNGFKPIKNELCENDISSAEDSKCQNKTEITSQKPVPSVPFEHLAHSLNDSEPFSSKGCDIHKKTVIKSSNKSDHGRKNLKDLSGESDFFDGVSLPVCNSSKDIKDSNHILPENKLDDICDQSKTCTTESYTKLQVSECSNDFDKVSIDRESCLPSDKFDCSFESTENNPNFADFRHSENLFPPYAHSSTIEFDAKFPTAFDESSSDTALKSHIEKKQRSKFSDNEFSDSEFEDFQACKKGTVSAVAVDSSEITFKPNIEKTEISKFSDSGFANFQDYEESVSSVQGREHSQVMLQSAIEDKQEDELSDYEFDDFQACGENMAFAQAAETSVKSDRDDYDDFQEFQFSDAAKEDADDFADFQDFNAQNVSSTDDFANFQDFNAQNASGSDDFANFQDFNAQNTSNTDDFADFSSASFESNKTSQPSGDSNFADFKEATSSAPVEPSSHVASAAAQKSIDTLSTVINAIFPVADIPENCDTTNETSPQILEQSNKSRRLWEKLHEVEQIPGLRFQWGVSHSFQQLLRAVNVDYHSILRTSSVPIFASGLSLLEPVKGLSSSANHESEDRNQIPKDPIPPVEFDWTSSGLVNPLDSGQTASTLMDLSFLSSVNSSSKGTSNDNSFESELLKPSPAFKCPESNSQTHILEQLLSKNVSSLPNSKLSRRPSDLSNEAIRVLDQLPDLSFMQAKVLMFPISSKT